MYCQNCGNQLREGTKFCPKCGAPVPQLQGKGTTYNHPSGRNGNAGGSTPGGRPAGAVSPGGNISGGAMTAEKKRKVPVFAIGAIVILAIVVLFILNTLFGGSYKTPIKNLVEGVEKQDGKQIMKAFPDEVLDLIEEETGYDRDEMAEELEDSFSNLAGIDLTDVDYEIDYEIEDAFDLSEREVREIEDDLAERDLVLEIEAGKEVEVTLTGRVKDGESNTEAKSEETLTIEVIKVGGNWYVNADSF